jgi:hypothetical protein
MRKQQFTRTRKVRQAYRQHMLAQVCTLPEENFGPAFGMQTVRTDGRAPDDYYHYRDNGSRVLAVAHLDTVVARNRRAPRFSNTKDGPLVVSGALDDRLGAYVILGLLPKLGVNCDVLLTVGEEQAASTAEHFQPSKDYDWIIEFDRAGTDVVMYQYEDGPSCRAVEAAGAQVGFGSFSDIAYLEHLGVKAFNWGVGYEGNYHSVNGYAYLNDTFAMVARYMRFHEQNAGAVMPHEPAPLPRYDASKYNRPWVKGPDGVWREDDSAARECIACCALDSIDGYGYCYECDFCQDCASSAEECQCYPARDTLRDWKADAEGSETADDAVAGAMAAWETSTGTGWAGAELALGTAVTDVTKRARRMQDAVSAFKAKS